MEAQIWRKAFQLILKDKMVGNTSSEFTQILQDL